MTKTPENDEGSRREFLTRSSVLMAALGTGVTAAMPALAHDEDLAAGVNRIFQMAMRQKGDIDFEAAAKEVGIRLPDEVLKSMSALTPEDWAAAARIDSKLSPLEDALGPLAANNGYLGM